MLSEKTECPQVKSQRTGVIAGSKAPIARGGKHEILCLASLWVY